MFQIRGKNTNLYFVDIPFLDLHLIISEGFVSSKIYDKRDDFDIVNFPFLDGDIPRAPSFEVQIFQLIRFARVSCHVADFNTQNGPRQANLCFRAFRHDKLQLRMSSHSEGPGIWLSV